MAQESRFRSIAVQPRPRLVRKHAAAHAHRMKWQSLADVLVKLDLEIVIRVLAQGSRSLMPWSDEDVMLPVDQGQAKPEGFDHRTGTTEISAAHEEIDVRHRPLARSIQSQTVQSCAFQSNQGNALPAARLVDLKQ